MIMLKPKGKFLLKKRLRTDFNATLILKAEEEILAWLMTFLGQEMLGIKHELGTRVSESKPEQAISAIVDYVLEKEDDLSTFRYKMPLKLYRTDIEMRVHRKFSDKLTAIFSARSEIRSSIPEGANVEQVIEQMITKIKAAQGALYHSDLTPKRGGLLREALQLLIPFIRNFHHEEVQYRIIRS